MLLRRGVALALVFLTTVGATAKSSSLPDKLAEIAKKTPGNIGAAAMLLETGEQAAFQGGDHFPMQSVYKLPISMAILALVDKGELTLEQKILVTKGDLVPESMHSPFREQNSQAGVEVSLAELLTRTIAESDGTTSDVLMRLAGGGAAVQEYLGGLGVEGITIATTEKEMGLDHSAQYRNWGTPDAFVQLLRVLQKGRAISDESRAFLLDVMIKSKPGPQRIKAMLPPNTLVAHKTGTSGTKDGITAACNDVGILTLPNGKHIAVAVFVSDSPADADAREGAIAQIARAAWDHWSGVRD